MDERTLEELVDQDQPPHMGMVPGAAWDSLLMLRKEDWTFDLMVSWHFGCYIGKLSPERLEAHRAETPDDDDPFTP